MQRVNYIRKCITVTISLFTLVLTGCTGRDQIMDGDGMFNIDDYDEEYVDPATEGDYESMEPTAIVVISVG